MRSKGKATVGRPFTGIHPGEKSSEYKRLAVRLPDDTLAVLDAIARVVKRPVWRVIADAVSAYLGDTDALSDSDRRLARALLRRAE